MVTLTMVVTSKRKCKVQKSGFWSSTQKKNFSATPHNGTGKTLTHICPSPLLSFSHVRGWPLCVPRGEQKAAAKKTTKAKIVKFTIDCQQPVEDKVLDVASFEKFLHDRIKVNGKAGALGDAVVITRDKTKLVVAAQLPFSKRYVFHNILNLLFILFIHFNNFCLARAPFCSDTSNT
jgi:hypothetical protein